MTLATSKTLPRLFQSVNLEEWSKRLVEELNLRLSAIATEVNSLTITIHLDEVVSPNGVAVTIGTGPTGSTAGDPVGWLQIDVSGTPRYIPFW